MNSDLLFLKSQVESYYLYLKNTILISNLFKGLNIQLSSTPSTPVLHVNKKEIPNGHPYYKPASEIIYKIWNIKWFCVECAIYKKNRKFIIRTTKQLRSNKKAGNKTKLKKQWKTNRQKFIKKSLNCISVGKKKVECIDSLFGIFEI
ncbi:MAG: hypothetical protein OXM55_01440 [Bdellovibrionales bacterium]|nr:hypothetical protein [Bdellovibrionales bacterium]